MYSVRQHRSSFIHCQRVPRERGVSNPQHSGVVSRLAAKEIPKGIKRKIDAKFRDLSEGESAVWEKTYTKKTPDMGLAVRLAFPCRGVSCNKRFVACFDKSNVACLCKESGRTESAVCQAEVPFRIFVR